MDTSKEYASAAGAARDYFGGLNGDNSAGAFMKEWKALTDNDKREIYEGLVALGYKIKG